MLAGKMFLVKIIFFVYNKAATVNVFVDTVFVETVVACHSSSM